MTERTESEKSPRDSQLFQNAIARIDAANSEDPTQIDGEPGQVIYARRMSEELKQLYPEAPVALQLAARSQHIRRWQIPRDSYPMTRAGYHQWRTKLYGFHAEQAGQILREVGYEAETIARVQGLLRKEKLKADPLMQSLEDVICVVFLKYEFAEFAQRHEEEKLLTILRRTWAKMSQVGREAALQLNLPAEAMAIIAKALAPQ